MVNNRKDPGFLLGEIHQGQKNLTEKFENLEKKIDNQISLCAARFIRDEKKVSAIESWKDKVNGAFVVVGVITASTWAKILKLF